MYDLINTMEVVGLVVASTDHSSRIHLGSTWRLHRISNWEFADGLRNKAPPTATIVNQYWSEYLVLEPDSQCFLPLVFSSKQGRCQVQREVFAEPWVWWDQKQRQQGLWVCGVSLVSEVLGELSRMRHQSQQEQLNSGSHYSMIVAGSSLTRVFDVLIWNRGRVEEGWVQVSCWGRLTSR